MHAESVPGRQYPYPHGDTAAHRSGTPLYDSLVLEWQGLDRCSPECCRPGMTPVHHLGGAGWFPG
ncbi:hypothetical protein [Streptomyces sp. NPDC001594]|uniref:hypothetical protein n=1 Tax=Streptomyces sp. NPDC001594 TaxID=3364590 RepID=UPI0036D15C06